MFHYHAECFIAIVCKMLSVEACNVLSIKMVHVSFWLDIFSAGYEHLENN